MNYRSKISITIYLFVFAIIPALSYSQYEITGFVIDTAGAVPYANIRLTQDSNRIVKGTISGENGKFMLNADNGIYNIMVSFVGYKNYEDTIIITGDRNLGHILLIKDASILNEVVITGRKNLVERKADKLIFNVENSPVKSGFDGVEILKRAPSIFVDSKDNILVNNKTATILINGRKISLSGDDLANYIKNIDASNIKRIEIQSNTSSEMDANVQGGTINFGLKKNASGLNAQIKSYHERKGSHPAYISSANINYGTEKWNIYSSIYYNHTEDGGRVESSTIYNYINRLHKEKGNFTDKYKHLQYSIGTTYQPTEKHELGIELYSSSNNNTNRGSSEIEIFLDDAILDKGITNSPGSRNTHYINTSFNYSIRLDTLGSKIRFIGDYAKQNFDNRFHSNTTYSHYYYNDISERSNTNASTDLYSAQVDYNKTMKFLGDIYLGLKITSTQRINNTIGENLVLGTYEVDNRRTSAYDFSENIYASYISISKLIIKSVHLKTGLRIENASIKGQNLLNNLPVSQNYFDFFPSVFLLKELKNNQSITFNYNRKIGRPAFSSLNPYTIKINDFTYQIGNPDLKPQYRNNFELAYNLKRHAFSTFFYQTQSLIAGTYFIEDNALIYQAQNIGKQNITGVNYNFSDKLRKWWFLKIGTWYKYQSFSSIDSEFYQHSASVYINNDWTISDSWSINLSTYYSSPYIYGYFRFEHSFSSDFMVQKAFLDKKLKVRFYVDDIFNTLRDKNRGTFDEFTFNFYQKRNTQSFTLYAAYTIDSKNKIRKKKNKSSNTEGSRL